MKGKRKTQDPCLECYLHKSLCMCECFKTLDLKTRVLLVTHQKELKRTTNTGRLALKILLNSNMRQRGIKGDPLNLKEDLKGDYQSLLLYPSKDAQILTREFISKIKKPIQLIVPDGNWRQASKVHTRHNELKDVPRVMLKDESQSINFIRKESKEDGMATMQAIAYALKIIEGDEPHKVLLDIYSEKLRRTLKSRGLKF